MASSKIGAFVGVVLCAARGAVFLWLSAPSIDRTAGGSNPFPMSVADPSISATTGAWSARARGAHFYDNTRDFNVAGSIFEQETGLSIGAAIETWLARPSGMQDFHPAHMICDTDASGTDHRT